jgi:rSAM/selenodomain-associated transferase 1
MIARPARLIAAAGRLYAAASRTLPMAPRLLIFAKRPAPGRTKTRLCPPLSAEAAAALYECFLRDTLDIARAAPAAERIVAFLPEDAAGYFAGLAPDMALAPQRGTDLGERMDRLLAEALRDGGPAVAIGSDSPTLPPAHIAAAFAHLNAGADVALGPSDDGGYYLIGLRRPQPRLLREVPMSTPDVLRATLALAGALGLRVALLPAWYDVDTAAELERLRAELMVSPGTAQHTRAFLEELDTHGARNGGRRPPR